MHLLGAVSAYAGVPSGLLDAGILSRDASSSVTGAELMYALRHSPAVERAASVSKRIDLHDVNTSDNADSTIAFRDVCIEELGLQLIFNGRRHFVAGIHVCYERLSASQTKPFNAREQREYYQMEHRLLLRLIYASFRHIQALSSEAVNPSEIKEHLRQSTSVELYNKIVPNR